MLVAFLLLAAQDMPKAPPGPDDIDPPQAPSATASRTAGSDKGPTRWSIASPDPCAGDRAPDHITVCGESIEESQRGVFRGTGTAATPSNPDVRGIDALHLADTPCADRIGGCQVGVDIFSGAAAAINLVRKVVNPDSCCEEPGEATDTSQRTPIDLSDPASGNRRVYAGPSAD